MCVCVIVSVTTPNSSLRISRVCRHCTRFSVYFFLNVRFLVTRVRNPIVIHVTYLSFFHCVCMCACVLCTNIYLFFAVLIIIIHLLICLHPVMRHITKGGGFRLYRCMNETLFKMKFFTLLCFPLKYTRIYYLIIILK